MCDVVKNTPYAKKKCELDSVYKRSLRYLSYQNV